MEFFIFFRGLELMFLSIRNDFEDYGFLEEIEKDFFFGSKLEIIFLFLFRVERDFFFRGRDFVIEARGKESLYGL